MTTKSSTVSCCGLHIETTCHYLLHCANFANGRSVLLNTISTTNKCVLTSCNSTFVKLLLHWDESLDLVAKSLILNASVDFILLSKAFDGSFTILDKTSYCNGTRTHSLLLCKRWLYGAFNCIFLSCHVRVLDVCKGLSIRLRSCVSGPVSHLNFRHRACFEQGVPWHSGNYRDWIHSATRKWHDKNM